VEFLKDVLMGVRNIWGNTFEFPVDASLMDMCRFVDSLARVVHKLVCGLAVYLAHPRKSAGTEVTAYTNASRHGQVDPSFFVRMAWLF
jgi:hypothetical protein